MVKKILEKQPVAAEPVLREVAAPAPVVTLKLSEPLPPSVDPGRCQDCQQWPTACRDSEGRPRHVVVTLVRDVRINGVLYPAGHAVLPEDAFGVWRYAVKE